MIIKVTLSYSSLNSQRMDLKMKLAISKPDLQTSTRSRTTLNHSWVASGNISNLIITPGKAHDTHGINSRFEIPQPLASFWFQTVMCSDVGEETCLPISWLCPGAWGHVKSLSIASNSSIQNLTAYSSFIRLIYSSTHPVQPWRFLCCWKQHCCTFNAGALIGVAISCHYRILHQLMRDRAAKLFGVCHQPLYLGKTSASSGF